jgi:hypothetical protein
MTEPDTCSEVYSDIEKSIHDFENNSSRRRSPTDNYTDTSINTVSKKKFQKLIKNLIFYMSTSP